MKTEKLTLEWIHKYYKAKIKYEDDVYNVIMIHTLNDMIAIHYKGVNASQTNTVNISDCKLILRPVSSLTDEEKKIREELGEWVDDTHSGHWIETKESIDWARENNIDFETPSLQQRGIAVYE